MYLLTKDDYIKMEELQEVTTSITECYVKLEYLEKKQLKNILEYQKILEQLKRLTAKEDEIYAKVTSSEQAKGWYDYFNKGFALSGNSIINKFYKRMLNVLAVKIISPEAYKNSKTVIEEATSMFKNGILNSLDEAKECLWKRECFKGVLYKEYSLLALQYMCEYFDNPAFGLFRDKMVGTKYNIAYLSRDVEKELLANNFDVPMHLVFNSSSLAYSLGIQKEMYLLFRDTQSIRFAMSDLKAFEKQNNAYYQDENVKNDSLIHLCFLKAALCLMGENGRHAFEKLVAKIFRNKPNMEISLSMINKALDEVKNSVKRG